MKRSEMLDRIRICVFEADMKDLTHKETAIELLDLIECAGMLPPDSKGELDQWNEGFIASPEWEPENE